MTVDRKAILGVWPNLSVEITGETVEIVRELAFWDNVPHECPFLFTTGDRKGEICGSGLHFTFRLATAKQGPRKGQQFPYYGLQCTGEPSHECQISQGQGDRGLFIREGNRQDGQPNWRLTYRATHEEEEENDHAEPTPQPQQRTNSTPSTGTTNGHIGEPGYLNNNQYKELVRVGGTKGMNEQETDQHCQDIYGCPLNELPAKDVVEYRKTLMAL